MKKNIISILIVFLQIAMVIALIFLFGLNIKIEESWILIFTLIGSLIFSVYFHVITHELGHLIFGLMSGFQFVSFHFFSHLWYRDLHGKIKHQRHRQAGILGQALMKYPHDYHDDMPYFWYNAGGVIVNLIFAVISVVILYFNINGVVNVFFLMFFYMAMTFALGNGIPQKDSFNDARNIYTISKSKRIKKAFYDQLSMSHQLITTPVENIEIDNYLEDDISVGMVVGNNVINYYKALARGEQDQAWEIISKLYQNIDQIITPMQALIYSEYLTMVLLHENNIIKVINIFSSMKNNIETAILTVKDSPFLRAKYLYYKYYKPDDKKREKTLDTAYLTIKDSYQKGLKDISLNLLDAVASFTIKEGTENV